MSHTGGSASEATQLQLYLSQDADISTDDSPQGEMQPVEALAPDASADVNITVTLPPMTGSYYYGACITPANSNENCSSGVEFMVSELAQAVEPGSMTEASLTAGGTDYFQFILESAQPLAIHTSGTTNTTGSLYDARGGLLATDENSGEGDNFYIDRMLSAGTYFIQVQGADTSVQGGYTLHVIPVVMFDSMTGRTLAAGASDYFQFTLASAQSLLIIYTSGGIDVTGTLYDSDGMPLATDEDSGGGGNFRINRPLTAGTYLIEVSGADASVTGGYTLHVEMSSITTTTVKPGSLTDSTLAAGVTHYFQFTLASARDMAIYTVGETNVTGRLYDADFMPITTDENSGDGDNFSIDRMLAAGTYFIRVGGADTSVSGGYTLRVIPVITTGSMTAGSLPAGVSDYFQFTLASSQRLAVYTNGTTNATGHLYDHGGTLLVTDENSGDGDNFRIERLLAAGTYLIEVEGADMSVMGGYTLRVEGASVTPVKPGSITNRNLAAGVSDYFQFTLANPQRLAVYTSGMTDVTGSLYDGRGRLLVTDENSGEGDNFRIERMLAPSTYFIRVSGDSSSTSGGYTLNVIPVVTPGSMTASSFPTGGSDYFQFTLASAQNITIHTSGTTLQAVGHLYNDDGMRLARGFIINSGSESRNIRIARLLGPGTYFIQIEGELGDGGDYTLHIEGVSVTTAALGSMTTSSLSAGGQDDFHFTLTDTKGLAIYTEGTTDVTGRLYNGEGTLLVTNEDSGNFRIDRPLVPGTYFIRVSGNDMSTSGAYTLHVEGFSVTAATVNPMTAPSYTLAAGGSDYFQFTLASIQDLTISTSGMTDVTGALYDNSGRLLAMDANSGDMSNFRIQRSLLTGIYFIRVSGDSSTVMGAYTLNITGASVAAVMLDAMNTGTAMGTLAAGVSDYFHFTLTSVQRLAIYTSGMVNTTGGLYDSDGVLLASDENSGDGNNFRISRLLAPGTYFIEVEGADMSAAGAYTLNITVADTVTKLTLPSMAGETEMSRRTPSPATGTDYFWLEIDTEQTLTIWSSYIGLEIAGANLRITVYGANANILVEPGSTANASLFRISRIFMPGIYFLGVRANNYNRAYTLNIRRE